MVSRPHRQQEQKSGDGESGGDDHGQGGGGGSIWTWPYHPHCLHLCALTLSMEGPFGPWPCHTRLLHHPPTIKLSVEGLFGPGHITLPATAPLLWTYRLIRLFLLCIYFSL